MSVPILDPWAPDEPGTSSPGLPLAVRVVVAVVVGALGPAWLAARGYRDVGGLALAFAACAAVVAYRALARRPVTGLSLGLVIGAQVAWARVHPELAVVILVAAAVCGEVAAVRRVAGRAAERSVDAVVRAIAVVLVLLVALPTLYIPAAIARAWRTIRRRPAPTSHWRPREVDDRDLRREELQPFSPTPRRVRRHRAYAAVAAIAVLVPVAVVVRDRRTTVATPPSADKIDAHPVSFPDWAFPDEPWVDELFAAGWEIGYHPSLGWRQVDEQSRWVVQRDGVRRSWEPDDRPVFTVWFLGGSAVWGVGQRDFETIPSEIAKRADAAGLPIEVVNLGVCAQGQWQEQAIAEERLARGERPDLMVFYDGTNDFDALRYRAGEGITPLDERPNRQQYEQEQLSRLEPEVRSGRPATRAEMVRAFDRTYVVGVRQIAHIAESYGVGTAFYWQAQYAATEPSPVDRPLLEEWPVLASPQTAYEREDLAAVRAQLPPEVHDLGGALSGAGEITFFDKVHTNERGAELVADAMWTTLEPTLRALPAR